MTNLIFTISIVVTTNWAGGYVQESPNHWRESIQVGRLQTNYVVSTTNPIHPALTADPHYGPWEFVRPAPLPVTFDTNGYRLTPTTLIQ